MGEEGSNFFANKADSKVTCFNSMGLIQFLTNFQTKKCTVQK